EAMASARWARATARRGAGTRAPCRRPSRPQTERRARRRETPPPRPRTDRGRARWAGRTEGRNRAEVSRPSSWAHHQRAERMAGALPFDVAVARLGRLERMAHDLAGPGVEGDVVVVQVDVAVGVALDVDGD